MRSVKEYESLHLLIISTMKRGYSFFYYVKLICHIKVGGIHQE